MLLQVFDGNSDSNSIQTNYILPTFHSRYVRVHPESWKNRICMRIEFYGCKSTGQDQGELNNPGKEVFKEGTAKAEGASENRFDTGI